MSDPSSPIRSDRLPVLVLPGWKDRARALRHLVSGLVANGWPESFVTAIDFDDPFGSNVTHAREIAAAIRSIQQRTGTERVDIIAHSMGGLALRRFLADSPATPGTVRRAVFLGTPHRGTWIAWLAWGPGAREMRPGSRFLLDLQHAPPPNGVLFHCVRSRVDSHVIPGRSAELSHARIHMVRTVTHRGMLRHSRIVDYVVRALSG